ncbi:hypothetical protein AK812_SmicGene48602, partial [Symbiodinium microadriaticum]
MASSGLTSLHNSGSLAFFVLKSPCIVFLRSDST